MDSCPNCGAEMVPLFTGSACKAECDLRPVTTSTKDGRGDYAFFRVTSYPLHVLSAGQCLLHEHPSTTLDYWMERAASDHRILLLDDESRWNGEYYEYTDGEWVYGKVEDSNG